MSVIDDQSRPSLARGVRLRTDSAAQEPVLLFPEGAIHLSQTAYDILVRCGGELTTQSIIESLAVDYDADPHVLRDDVLNWLAELHERKLVVFSK